MLQPKAALLNSVKAMLLSFVPFIADILWWLCDNEEIS